MKYTTHHRVLTLFTILCLMACKKNKISETERPPAPEKPLEIKKLVPVKFESAGSTLQLKYKDNTALLTEIGDGDGNKLVIGYTAGHQPAQLEKYKKGRLFYIAYYVLDDQKKVAKVLTFDYDHLGNYTPTGFYTLAYHDLERLHTISYYNHTDDLSNTCTRSYTQSGGLSEMELNMTKDPGNRMTYTFDQKAGVSSFIPYSQLFTLEADHWFLFCAGNNVLSCQNQKLPLENVNFTYEYNEDGYPSKISVSKNKTIQSIKVTYKILGQ